MEDCRYIIYRNRLAVTVLFAVRFSRNFGCFHFLHVKRCEADALSAVWTWRQGNSRLSLALHVAMWQARGQSCRCVRVSRYFFVQSFVILIRWTDSPNVVSSKNARSVENGSASQLSSFAIFKFLKRTYLAAFLGNLRRFWIATIVGLYLGKNRKNSSEFLRLWRIWALKEGEEGRLKSHHSNNSSKTLNFLLKFWVAVSDLDSRRAAPAATGQICSLYLLHSDPVIVGYPVLIRGHHLWHYDELSSLCRL